MIKIIAVFLFEQKTWESSTASISTSDTTCDVDSFT